MQGDAGLGSQPATTTDRERPATTWAYVLRLLRVCGSVSDLAQIGPKRWGATDGVTDGRTDEQVVAGARRPEGVVAGRAPPRHATRLRDTGHACAGSGADRGRDPSA